MSRRTAEGWAPTGLTDLETHGEDGVLVRRLRSR